MNPDPPPTLRKYYGHHTISHAEQAWATQHGSPAETYAAHLATATRALYEAAARGADTLDPTSITTRITYIPGTSDLRIIITATTPPRQENNS